MLIGLCRIAVLASLLCQPIPVRAEDPSAANPLQQLSLEQLPAVLAAGTALLIEPEAIERFLQALDGSPPDWTAIYGHGHHDPRHDERLFNLNRARDTARQGNQALSQRVAFLWSGALSEYDAEQGGFPVVLGPRFTPTLWGIVRFKYEDLPGNLVALTTPDQRTRLLAEISRAGSVEIHVVMAGTLIPDESIVYDFSHDQDGLGLIMPIVRVDQLLYLSPSPFP